MFAPDAPPAPPRAASPVPFIGASRRWHNGRYDVAVGVVPLAWLRDDPRNPRRIGAAEQGRLSTSLGQWGLVETVVADEHGVLIGGHQRTTLERATGGAEILVCVVFGISDEDRLALAVALNNPGAQGEYAAGPLRDVLSHLDATGYDATRTGFDLPELESLLTWTPDLPDPFGPDAKASARAAKAAERQAARDAKEVARTRMAHGDTPRLLPHPDSLEPPIAPRGGADADAVLTVRTCPDCGHTWAD